MIIRNKRLNTNANEVMLSVCFSKVDVLKWLRRFTNIYCKGMKELEDNWINTMITEKDVRNFLEQDGMVLGSFEERWREQLSAWAWNVAVREKYLKQSSTPGEGHIFYPTETLLKKVGRPRKD